MHSLRQLATSTPSPPAPPAPASGTMPSAEKVPPPLDGLGTVDPYGGFSLGVVESESTKYEIATYTWMPGCSSENVRGVVHLLHGVFGYTCFEWLTPDEQNHRTQLRNSLVSQLLDAELAVIGHDHPAHGRSSGLHGYVDTLDFMRDAAIDVVESMSDFLPTLPRFLVGMSMGATTCINVLRKRPELFAGACLISPAVRPPDDMFGWWGTFLRAVNRPLGWLVPRLPVLSLPGSHDPMIRDAVYRDPLVYKGAMRVRLGQEFLRVYDDINACADEISFKRVAIFVGRNDNIVSPNGIKQFYTRIRCDDKKLFCYEGLSHEVMREQGCEKARADLVDWICHRVDDN